MDEGKGIEYYRLNVKPLSVNEVWQGKRFKTPAYKGYEKLLLLSLKPINLHEPPYRIWFRFGFSNVMSDFDNPVKPFVDVLQKKYKFNDRDIYESNIIKFKVNRGEEFIDWFIESISDTMSDDEIAEKYNIKP